MCIIYSLFALMPPADMHTIRSHPAVLLISSSSHPFAKNCQHHHICINDHRYPKASVSQVPAVVPIHQTNHWDRDTGQTPVCPATSLTSVSCHRSSRTKLAVRGRSDVQSIRLLGKGYLFSIRESDFADRRSIDCLHEMRMVIVTGMASSQHESERITF